MSASSTTAEDLTGDDSVSEDASRRSNIAFPYIALDEAVAAALAIHNNAGRECELVQLAAWLGSTAASSKFRSTMSAARMFDLIQRRAKMVSLTELGTAIVDPEQREPAAVEAFLKVPLYRSLYDNFSAQLLPPDPGLEAEMRSMGVTAKSVSKARQVFQRSATYAGYFRAGRNRLVRPATSARSQEPTPIVSEEDAPNTSEQPLPRMAASAPATGPTDPLLLGLWSKLPPEGSLDESQQVQWLEMARLALKMVYGEGSSASARPLAPTPSLTPPPVDRSAGDSRAEASPDDEPS